MSTGNIDFVAAAPMGVVPFADVAIRLHPIDDVAIAKTSLRAGTILDLGSGVKVKVRRFIPNGHKVALRDIAPGEAIRRYGQVIGFTTEAIPVGEHVHTHNLAVKDFVREAVVGVDVKPVDFVPERQRRTFMGYRRPNGRVGTRNYIGIISNVNCSAHTVREIAHYFTPERLAAYPNVDGVIALAHLAGCATQVGGDDQTILQRTLAGMAQHANVAAYILIGLGCESNQIDYLITNYNLRDVNNPSQPPPSITIQGSGGIRKTIAAGIEAVEELLPLANAVKRTQQPISELMVALQCGGSDSWSGVTANPLVGMVSDEIVRQGGTVVLAETPEIYGAEHLLMRRAASPEVGEKLMARIHWWEDHTKQLGIEMDNNPSVGNKAGGLTTIYEKSLGAAAKGGSTPLTAVYNYAEPVTDKGFTFMDSPGYDPVSVTGEVAGGCNLVLFTTGRGSVFGFKPAPSVKIASNSEMYNHMVDDMDFNAGRALEGDDMGAMTQELLDMVIAVASGQPSKSEAQGVGESEFNPWNLGGTL